MLARTRTIGPKTISKKLMSTNLEDAKPSYPLNIVSWNISSAQPSQVAPNQTSRRRDAASLIREEVLRKSPEIVALQETAFPEQGGEIFHDYTSLGTRSALHTYEYVDLLIRREAFSGVESIAFPNLPAVGAVLSYHGTKFAVASIHLPHTRQAAPFRRQLCQSILECIKSHTVSCILLIGDFNMRKDEDKFIEQMGGGLVDAWKEVTNSDKQKMFTWNGRENLYHGLDSFRFTARFDRCYVRGERLRAREFDLVGDRPVEGRGDYLSDHYGMFVGLDIITVDEVSNSSSFGGNGEQSASDGTNAKHKSCDDNSPDKSYSTETAAMRMTSNASTNRPTNAEELRRKRLQRFETNLSTINNEGLRASNNRVVDLTEDSDDEVNEKPNKKARDM